MEEELARLGTEQTTKVDDECAKRQTERGESDRVVLLKWRRLGVVGAMEMLLLTRVGVEQQGWHADSKREGGRQSNGAIVAHGVVLACIEKPWVTGWQYGNGCVGDDH